MRIERTSLFCCIVLAVQCAVSAPQCFGQTDNSISIVDAAKDDATQPVALFDIDIPESGKVDVGPLHKAMDAYAKKAVVTTSLAEPKPAKLHKKPIFRWENPERNTVAGNMYLWTINGRPQTTLCVWCRRGGTAQYEMQSFSETLFKVTLQDQSWTPTNPGLKFAELSDEQTPATGASRRAFQMRRIMLKRFRADGFKYNQTTPDKLRLLTTPIYKYKELPTGVIDGAMYSFAMGTDPEVLVILEARQTNKDAKPKWFYAIAPSTMMEVKGYLDNKQVFRTYHLNEESGAYMRSL